MMRLDGWWFTNQQQPNAILQPDCFTPRTHCGVYAELDVDVSYPIAVEVVARIGECELYRETYCFAEKVENAVERSLSLNAIDRMVMFSAIVESVTISPDAMDIVIRTGGAEVRETVACAYATISGRITDFAGKPFPASVLFYRYGFGTDSEPMGVWSDAEGFYTIDIPQGMYNCWYIDDESYGKTSLEGWAWHMIVDRDEQHDFKINNAEVYSLCVWANNGGMGSLFFYFRPMTLTTSKKYAIELDGRTMEAVDIAPQLEASDINVTIDGNDLRVLSLQKIYEYNDNPMPGYVLQTSRHVKGQPTTGKHTVIIEYDTAPRVGESGIVAQSQGRMQFYYKDAYALTLS